MPVYEDWDVVVVGAGPAGAIAAREAALSRASVLLVDKSPFPRPKVCGCCVNAAALSQLARAGLGELPRKLGAQPLNRFRLAAGGRQATLSLPGGVSVSRSLFDGALVDAAVSAGAQFRDGTEAVLEPSGGGAARTLRLWNPAFESHVRAGAVIAADGLGGRLLAQEPGFSTVQAAGSRIGAGTVVAEAPKFYQPGTIYMACAPGGYAGLVRLEDGRLDVAAAFDAPFLRSHGGAGQAAAQVLTHAGFPEIDGLEKQPWRGTQPLTRRKARQAGERVFAVGDSAGYVEPFTGEGIAWALATGRAVVRYALRSGRVWDPAIASDWDRRYAGLLAGRQASCRVVSKLLRKPALMRWTVGLLSFLPAFGSPVIRRLSAPWSEAA